MTQPKPEPIDPAKLVDLVCCMRELALEYHEVPFAVELSW